MTGGRSDQERWHALMDALSDETVAMPDEAILREFGSDADQASDLVRSIIHASVGDVEVTPYEATKAALDREKENTSQSALPRTPAQRRSMLELILTSGHSWSNNATVAFRELGNPADLTDDEIIGILEDLADLNDDDDA